MLLAFASARHTFEHFFVSSWRAKLPGITLFLVFNPNISINVMPNHRLSPSLLPPPSLPPSLSPALPFDVLDVLRDATTVTFSALPDDGLRGAPRDDSSKLPVDIPEVDIP
jgi:hypothetical protein